jgi:hypothetical protein
VVQVINDDFYQLKTQFQRGKRMLTIEECIEKFKKSPIALQHTAEFNVLRPNDSVTAWGEEGFKTHLEAVRIMLDTPEYINGELRKYYYDMMEHEHQFQTLEHWKQWGRL